MKKRILQGLVVLALLIGGVLAFGATRRADYHVERSIQIRAPRENVYRVVSNLRRFDEWSPWSKLDPNLKTEVKDGDSSGQGATYTWTGNDDVGSGKMTVVD